MSEVFAYLGLGGNTGDLQLTFRQAISTLRSFPSTRSMRFSNLYRTEPWGYKDQPDFFNFAIEISWTSSLEELINSVTKIEKAAGKNFSESQTKWGPRPLDIDILFYNDYSGITNDYQVPHPRILDRRFVLVPLLDLIPDYTPPGWKCTISEALDMCKDNGAVEMVPGALLE